MMADRRSLTEKTTGDLEKYGQQALSIGMQGTRPPPLPRYRDIPAAPQPDFRNVFKESMPGLMFTTLLGSIFSRKAGLGAMAAATGYMEGFHTGDKERMENERKKWDDQVSAIIKQNEVEYQRNDAVWRNTNLSMADRQSKLNALAAAEGNSVKMDMLKRGDMNQLYQMNEDKRNATMKLYESQLRFGYGGEIDDSYARMIANYDMPPPTGRVLQTEKGRALLGKVHEINPSYSAQNYVTSVDALKKFGEGKQGDAIRSFGVALTHLDILQELADALHNNRYAAINEIKLRLREAGGDPSPTTFDQAKQIIADEVLKSVIGGAGGVEDRKNIAEGIKRSRSPEAIKNGIETFKRLGAGQLEGFEGQYKAATFRNDFTSRYLPPRVRQAYERYRPDGASQPQQTPTPGTIEDGHRFKGGDPWIAENWEAIQ
jgi:hypothetical protein